MKCNNLKMPNNVVSETKKIKDYENEKVKIQVDETDTMDMYDMDYIPEGQEEVKYNKYLEKIIRTSYEYRQFIKLMKTEMDLTQCKFIPLADVKESKAKIKLEMHHYPFTLYDIVAGVREKMKKDHLVKESFNSFKIADEVMRLHFEGKVGIVPLSYTAHELAHSGELFIPLNKQFVFGNW